MVTISKESEDKLLDKANVQAVGPAQERVDNAKTGEKAVTAFVHTKKDVSELQPEDLVPEEVEGYKTDVQEIGRVEIEPVTPKEAEVQGKSKGSFDPRQRMRPYPQGSSIGHQDITAGTAGRIMYRKAVKDVGGERVVYAEPVQYSNNHVIANENKAGERDNVLQPGPYDGAKNIDEEYGLNKWIKYVKLKEKDNLIDGAWCDLEGRVANSWQVNGDTPVKQVESLSEGDPIYKPRGRTTGYREGEVLSTSAAVEVKFGDGTRRFRDQIITTSVSSPGDSGSTVFKVNTGGEADADIGTLFAGSKKVTIVNKLENILAETGLYLNPEDVYKEVEK